MIERSQKWFYKEIYREERHWFSNYIYQCKRREGKCVADDLKCSNTDTSSEKHPSITAGSRCLVKYGPSRNRICTTESWMVIIEQGWLRWKRSKKVHGNSSF